MELQPSYIKAKEDGRFISKEVNVLNRGGASLIIRKVEGSCQCATGNILNGIVEPLSIGKIKFTVNTDGMKDTDSRLFRFTIYSNAKNSPYNIKMEILPPDSTGASVKVK